jgi:hypothetical protein
MISKDQIFVANMVVINLTWETMLQVLLVDQQI